MRTYCKHGHEWKEENIFTRVDGRKECRKCQSNWTIKSYKKRPWATHYRDARSRCYNKNNKRYSSYGDRGIKVIMSIADFKFLWFRDKAYNLKKPSIDRIDNDNNYELSNCRFIELSENSRKDKNGEKNPNSKLNKNQVVEIRSLYKNGKNQSFLSVLFRVSRSVISRIVNKKSWDHLEALK